MSEKYNEVMGKFVAAIGKEQADVEEALKSLIGAPGDKAVDLLGNDEMTPFVDIAEELKELEIPKAVLRAAVADLRIVPEPEPVVAPAAAGAPSADFLPNVPDDESFLSMLKTGGELKVDQGKVISAIRAALADRSELYAVPNVLIQAVENFAEKSEEPAPASFYNLRKMLTRREYAELFAAMDGVDGKTYATESRRNKFLSRIDSLLWPAVESFHLQVKAWTDSWQQAAGNPATMMNAIAAMVSGGGAASAGLMNQPPETDSLRDSAESVVDVINRVFAGTAIPTSMALAYDAMNIKKVLETPELPAQIGAPSRELMLKQLGLNVSADYVRLERNLTRYVLGIMEFSKISDGQEAISYITALFMLGNNIPWDKLQK